MTSAKRASAFDPALEYRFGKAIADEAIAQDANYFAGVCINLVRNPRWGRTQETYGEDPFLLGAYGAALTKSVQEEGMIACPEHFALNSIEDLRFFVNAKCDDRTLHEVYLPHFKKCIDAGAQSIMGAYNKFDGDYCCASKKLLTDILRDQWGFDGAEVVQVYVGSKGAANGDDRPVKLLKGFQRVELKTGEEKAVTITIPNAELKFWTPDGWVLDGAYTVYVGTDSRSATAI